MAGIIFQAHPASGKSACTDSPRIGLDTLPAESDILSLHCPLTDRNGYSSAYAFNHGF